MRHPRIVSFLLVLRGRPSRWRTAELSEAATACAPRGSRAKFNAEQGKRRFEGSICSTSLSL
jgi:hypothetical protein